MFNNVQGDDMVSKLLRPAAVVELTGESRSGLYAKAKAGLYSKPIKIGSRASAWPETEVAALQAARIAGKSQEEIRHLVRELEGQRLRTGA